MFVIKERITAALLSAMLATGSLPVMAADSFSDAFTEGDFKLQFRYRLELVDQEPFSEDATASTLQTRLNYTTADWSGLSLFAEFDYISELFGDDYKEGAGNTPGRGQFPVVADPADDDWNQAYLQYKSGNGQFWVGRQRIIFDNARFVGNVGWRQNTQTYDALSFSHKSDSSVQFTVAYIDNVNRIFGDDVASGDHEHSTALANVSKNFEGTGKLTAYWYDIDDEDAAGFSNTTWGLRFAGSRPVKEREFGYTFEYASQQNNANNPTPYDANYYRIDLSIGVGAATLYAGIESLEGDHTRASQAFRTPLATLHAFNGWADKFLATPAAGLDDSFFGAKGKVGAWSWNILYHDFSAQSGSADFGSEIDASISRKIGDRYGLLLKAARFDTDSPAYGDSNKIWVQVTAGFH